MHWGRSSSSGVKYGDFPEGEIDPRLKTFSLWAEEEPVVAWSCYAVHPMSYYGRGQVSADFPGIARAKRQQDDPRVLQIYFTGCAGDVTAGKYNTGDPANRPVLAERLVSGNGSGLEQHAAIPAGVHPLSRGTAVFAASRRWRLSSAEDATDPAESGGVAVAAHFGRPGPKLAGARPGWPTYRGSLPGV